MPGRKSGSFTSSLTLRNGAGGGAWSGGAASTGKPARQSKAMAAKLLRSMIGILSGCRQKVSVARRRGRSVAWQSRQHGIGQPCTAHPAEGEGILQNGGEGAAQHGTKVLVG